MSAPQEASRIRVAQVAKYEAVIGPQQGHVVESGRFPRRKAAYVSPDGTTGQTAMAKGREGARRGLEHMLNTGRVSAVRVGRLPDQDGNLPVVQAQARLIDEGTAFGGDYPHTVVGVVQTGEGGKERYAGQMLIRGGESRGDIWSRALERVVFNLAGEAEIVGNPEKSPESPYGLRTAETAEGDIAVGRPVGEERVGRVQVGKRPAGDQDWGYDASLVVDGEIFTERGMMRETSVSKLNKSLQRAGIGNILVSYRHDHGDSDSFSVIDDSRTIRLNTGRLGDGIVSIFQDGEYKGTTIVPLELGVREQLLDEAVRRIVIDDQGGYSFGKHGIASNAESAQDTGR